MQCPFCHYPDSRVFDSRETDGGTTVRRRRECPRCGRRFTTYERVDLTPFVVVKRDGRREQYDREKILRGIRLACKKRPVSQDAIEELVSAVEQELQSRGEREVASRDIGALVVSKLRQLDEVAYVRFASVYQEFNIQRFKEELERLGGGNNGDGSQFSARHVDSQRYAGTGEAVSQKRSER
ncbi:MAG: transcriptional repressor NrdR [Limnochordaceae bacterium]|nr:transcriptional repressor NrdR [Limnochordaceae bacterium]